MNTIINIGGVPEHFNYSWHKAIAQGVFLTHEIDLRWKDYPGGTGAMAQSLDAGELDMAIMLTEGAVAAISKGCPARIMHFAIRSPLLWGIHTGSGSSLQKEEDVKGKTFAISRYGSGSHLMAIVHALLKGWPLDHMQWLEVKNLDGAKQALIEGKADVFLWERYTTKPLVDDGTFRLLDLLPTPWPAFVLVVSNAFWAKHDGIAEQVSAEILQIQHKLKSDATLSQILAARYQLQEEDVVRWLAQTEWSSEANVIEKDVDEVISALLKAKVLDKRRAAEDILLQWR